MMATVVQEKTPLVQDAKIPPSVLLIGKKRTLDYIAPALFRVNNTGELVIKATGSLSIVTAVDVAEMVKRDVENLATKSITLGTDELTIATGERKRMSCIEIHLIKVSPIAVVTPPVIDVHVPVEAAAPAIVEIPIEEPTLVVEAEVPVVVAEEKAKKPRAKRKSTATTKKRAASRKKKAAA
jgi:DNA-binding protein Alba